MREAVGGRDGSGPHDVPGTGPGISQSWVGMWRYRGLKQLCTQQVPGEVREGFLQEGGRLTTGPVPS